MLEFIAKYAGSPITLRKQGDVWVGFDPEDNELGVLVTPLFKGWGSVHPKSREYKTLIINLGDSPEEVPQWPKEWVTGVCEKTDVNYSYRTLLSAVKVFVRPRYRGGMITEGEAWQQAVVLPERMFGENVTIEDLRRALNECGWVLRDPEQGYWYHTGGC